MKSETVSILRGLAIIGVVAVHTKWMFDGLSGQVKDVLAFGQFGCQVFFTLSSYCLCLSYEKRKGQTYWDFVKRRFLSLAPGYWTTIMLNLLISVISLSFLSVNIIPMDMKLIDILVNCLLMNGFVLSFDVMNFVVLGGWFVGTLMILYLLYPLLSKLYFIKNRLWESWRIFLFPFLITSLCWAVMILTGLGNDTFCENSSLKYFFFINQLPSFVLGFSLYDVAHRNTIRYPLIKAILVLSGSVFLFYVQNPMSNIICPTLISLMTIYLFVFLSRQEYSGIFNGIKFGLVWLGNSSYAIFLSHFWVVVSLVHLFKILFGFDSISSNETETYFVLLPVMSILVLLLASVYQNLIDKVKGKVTLLIK